MPPVNTKNKFILLFATGLALVFALCMLLRFPPGITVSLVMLLLIGIFYIIQEPRVIAICGALGLGMIVVAFTLHFDINGIKKNYLLALWGIGTLLYCAVFSLLWFFTVWLKKLREISKLHELVIAGTTAGLWKWKDLNSEEQWWSPRYYQLLGYENNEIPATLSNLNKLIHPDDRELFDKTLRDYMAGLRPDLECEYRIRTKSGEYKWFLGSGEVQFEKGSHRPLRVVGSIVNIDHKKQYEESLAWQASMFAMSPNAVATTDAGMIVTSWNEGSEKLYGIKAADAIGRNIKELYTNSYPYTTEEEVMAHFAEHGSWRGEVHQLTATGRKVYVLYFMLRLKSTQDLSPGIAFVCSDISMLRVNEELNAALKMVENSTQYLEQLSYVSSHDLKSPIITMQGLINHLAASKAIVPGHEATFEMLREIVDQMKATSTSLNGILQLRKNLTSREFAPEKVSGAQVLRDVIEMLSAAIESSGAEIIANAEKGIQIRMHHTFLKIILFNLISNSIKFSYPGRKPIVQVSLDVIKDNIFISVSDNGSGINLDRYKNKLFTIFTRFHDGNEGNGVGLHAVKMIVDFYKGEIAIDSEEGKGTKITIKLPIEPDAQN